MFFTQLYSPFYFFWSANIQLFQIQKTLILTFLLKKMVQKTTRPEPLEQFYKLLIENNL